MKQTELNLDQLQQIKGGSKFWGEECTANVGSALPKPQEYIDGVPNNIVYIYTNTCDYYVFGVRISHNEDVPTACGFEHFGL